MKTRKLILVTADILLLAVCIFQCALSARDTTKYFSLKDNPDMIVIDTPSEKGITVTLENDNWYVGKNKFPAKKNVVENFIESAKSIRVIDKVGNIGNEAALDRYELNDVKKTTVTFYKDGNAIRTLGIGKEAISSSQGYITVDDGKDIYLANGDLRSIYTVTEESIRVEETEDIEETEESEV